MARMVSREWANRIIKKLDDGEKLDETITHNVSANWLIGYLTKKNIPFKLYNMGAGVKRITTDTDTCPCCRRKLNG